MEFLTSHQKKKKARRLYYGYLLLGVLVLLATYVLVSTALGFEIFSSRGQVIQNGLLFVDSKPDNADIYINDKKESAGTNAKLTLPESTYSVKITKPGYRDWNGNVSLMGGTVEFLTYPKLMPITPKAVSTRVVATKPISMQSRDKRWVAYYQAESPGEVAIYDLDNPKDPSIVIPFTAPITAGKSVQSLRLLEWAGDNEHFMVAIDLVGGPTGQYVVMNRQKLGEMSNVSAIFGMSAGDSAGFWDLKRDHVFVRLSSGAVKLGNLKDNSLAQLPLFSDITVEFFAISKGRAIYTTKVGDELLVKFYANEKTQTITSAKDASKSVIVRSFDFNRNEYILVAGDGFDKTLIFRNFEKTLAGSPTGRVAPFFTMPNPSKLADVSKSSRFVMGSDGVNVQVYDIEQKEYLKYELPIPKPASIGWFDDSRLYAVGSDNSLSVLDFNGGNVYQLSADAIASPYVNDGVTMASYITKSNDQISVNTVDIESATE